MHGPTNVCILYPLNPNVKTKFILCFFHSVEFAHSHNVASETIVAKYSPSVASIAEIVALSFSFHTRILQSIIGLSSGYLEKIFVVVNRCGATTYSKFAAAASP